MNKIKPNIVILSSGFPFDDSEPFLETELQFLSYHFNQVIVVPIDAQKNGSLRPFPENCTFVEGNFQREYLSFGSIIATFFSVLLWKELLDIKSNPQFNWSLRTLKTAVVSLARAKKIMCFLENNNLVAPKTVFYSFWTDDAGIALALFKKKHSNLKCYTRAHGWDVYFNTNTLHYLPFRWLITQQLNGIVTDSQAGTDYIRANWKGAYRCLIQPARMGVNSHLKMAPIPKELVVVSCSNVVPVKRLHLLAEALISLSNQQNVTWVHFGDGPSLEAIQKRVEEAHHDKLIVDFKGHVPNEMVLQWYAEMGATVFVNVSESEGIPFSIMEAMSFGIPVIATDVGGNSEIVNETNGFLISKDFEIEYLKNQFLKYTEIDSNEYEKLKVGAVKMQEDIYSSEKNYNLLAELLKN